MIDLVLAILAVAFVGSLGIVEAVCIVTGQPTISRRLQDAARRNVQLAVALGVVVGWLIAHFTGWPG